ncbi:MAG TPA: polysaccharide deacetylase family protein [Bryobacteraceae bacterium]|nr:polysaccharide deacetylase family protein [Bryobacteraceae bacterium]
MTPATHPPLKIPFAAWLAIGVTSVIGLQALLYMTVIGNTIGSLSVFSSSKPANPAMSRDFLVGLVRSESSAHSNGARPEYYFDLGRQWETTLHNSHIGYRVISERDLTDGLGTRFAAIVLPSVLCLGDNERKALSEAVTGGLGIIASGALGSRDSSCNWRGWDYLSEMTGLRSPNAVPVAGPVQVAFRGQRYFSTELPAGFTTSLSSQEIVEGVADQPDVYWTDWRMRPQKGTSPASTALAVHGSLGRGRVAWFGFSETSATDGRKQLDAYLADSLRWVARQSIAIVGDWPAQKQSAVVVAEDVSTPSNALASAVLLQREGVPATFFCNSSARSAPALLRKLQLAGEVASAGDSLDPFGEQQTAVQTGRLMRVKHDLEAADSAIHVWGFNPPDGSLNQSTPAALLSAGYRYYFDFSEPHSAVPELIRSGGGSALLPSAVQELARINMTSSDDFSVVANYRGPTPWGDDMADVFLQDFQRISYLGGVYPLIFRSDLLGAPENLHILKTIVHRIKSEPTWTAKASDLVNWWSKREALRVDIRRLNTHRIRLAITNTGQQEITDASVYVYLPYRPRRYSVSSALLSLKLPRVELAGDDDLLRLDLPAMHRQSSQILVIALDE